MSDRRNYRMTARARTARETRERVLDAAILRFGEKAFERVSLAQVAETAGVGLQTVIRIGTSKEGLFEAAAERFVKLTLERHRALLSDDLRSSLQFLADAYESWGEKAMTFLAQEDRVPIIRRFVDLNRAAQEAWIEQVFPEALAELTATERRRRMAALLTVSGARSWYVLRRIHGLSQKETVLAMEEMVLGLMG